MAKTNETYCFYEYFFSKGTRIEVDSGWVEKRKFH